MPLGRPSLSHLRWNRASRRWGRGEVRAKVVKHKSTVTRLEAEIAERQRELESTKLAVNKLEEDFCRLWAVAGPPSACKEESGRATCPRCPTEWPISSLGIRGVAQTLLGATNHLQKEYDTYALGFPDGPPLGPAAWICSKSAQRLTELTSLCDQLDLCGCKRRKAVATRGAMVGVEGE